MGRKLTFNDTEYDVDTLSDEVKQRITMYDMANEDLNERNKAYQKAQLHLLQANAYVRECEKAISDAMTKFLSPSANQ